MEYKFAVTFTLDKPVQPELIAMKLENIIESGDFSVLVSEQKEYAQYVSVKTLKK